MREIERPAESTQAGMQRAEASGGTITAGVAGAVEEAGSDREGLHVPADRWSDEQTRELDDLDLLVYQSRLIGSDPSLVVWGGGNTSLKVWETDFRGRRAYVLRVKGSGSDLKAVTRADFPGVRMDDVLPLLEREAMSDEERVQYLLHTLMEPASPRPSIETLLHAFVPARSVVHTHADAILALTNNRHTGQVLAEVFGDEVAVIPYRRPGFALSKQVAEAVRERPHLKGVVLLNHGLITWHDDPAQAYRLHIQMVGKAARYAVHAANAVGASTSARREQARRPATTAAPIPATVAGAPFNADVRHELAARLSPVLRGLLSGAGTHGRVVLHFDDSPDVLRFVSGQVVPLDRMQQVLEQGAATPDHILNTKRTPVWVPLPDVPARGAEGEPTDVQALMQAVRQAHEQWVQRYIEYYQAHQSGEPMLPPVPRVVLVQGLGMFAVGKDSRAATIASDIYHHTITIIETAERLGGYRSLPLKDAFEAEYWPLELYKLRLAPAGGELSGQVALVTGAAGAIGSAIARRLAQAGAHVVCADLNGDGAHALAAELTRTHPTNRAMAVAMDVTDEVSVARGYNQVVLEYGGVDVVVCNAGVAHSAPLDELSLQDWHHSLAVNATGHLLVAREALRIMKAQNTGGSFVFIATKNVPAPGAEFGAYSASKAAEAQIARVLAIEGGPYGIRSNIINPDAVFEGSGLWSSEVRKRRALAQGIDPSELEEYYRRRNLLQTRITAQDVAEAVLFFASDRSAKTTGAMLPVDGGLREAFPR